MDQNEYIKERVDDQIAWYDRKATASRKMYVRLQMLILMLSMFIPIILVSPKLIGIVDISATISAVASIISIILAVLVALQSFQNYKEKWAAYRTTAETLKKEKYMFLTKGGKYSRSKDAFQTFVENVEESISREHTQWSQLIKVHGEFKGDQNFNNR